jgi:spore maturation protein CgeB
MTLRVIVFGAHGSHRTESSMVRALRALGHAAVLVDATRWRRLGPAGGAVLRRLVRGWAPDQVILTRYAAALDDETLHAVAAGAGTSLWFFDLVEQPHERILRLARAAGTMYVTCPSQVGLYRASGIPTVRFLPQAADPAIDCPARRVPRSYRCDVSFVGSGQHSYRHELLERLARACNLQVRGPGWDGMAGRLPVAGGPVRGRRFAQVVGGAAVSLGAFAFAAQREERACASNRMWKVMGCGGFYLGPRAPGLEHFARNGEHCAWYDSTEEALGLVQRYLADPAGRATIAEAGRRHSLAEHTYADRMRRILDGRDYPVP